MPIQSRMTRDEQEEERGRQPFGPSRIANATRYDPREDPHDIRKRNNGLYDRPPTVIDEKRRSKPTQAIADHASEVAKKKERREKLQALADDRSHRDSDTTKNPVTYSRQQKVHTTNGEHHTNQTHKGANVTNHNKLDTDADHDGRQDNDGSEDELNLSPTRDRSKAAPEEEEYEEEEGMDVNDREQTPALMDHFPEDGNISTPTRASSVSVADIPARKTVENKKAYRARLLEEHNLKRMEQSEVSRSQPAPGQKDRQVGLNHARHTSSSQPALSRTTSASSGARSSSPMPQVQKRSLKIPVSTSQSKACKRPRLSTTEYEDSHHSHDDDDENSDVEEEADDNGEVKGGRKHKPKLDDFSWKLQPGLNRAVSHFECRIITEKPFPDVDEELTLTTECIDLGLEECKQKVDVITEDMRRLLSYRTSTIRGRFKTVIGAHSPKEFGFRQGSSKAIRKFNSDLATTLMTNYLFTYRKRDANAKEDLFGNSLYVLAIAHVIFKSRTSLGFRFPEYFETASFELIALITTVIESSVDEWETGTYRLKSFTSKEYDETFAAHLAEIKGWHAELPARVAYLQRQLMTDPRKYFGHVKVKKPATKKSGIPREDMTADHNAFLARDSTDSEADDSDASRAKDEQAPPAAVA